MAKANFGSILDKPPSEVERPKPMPVGSYVTLIQGMPRYDKSTKKQTEFVEFTHKFISAGEDVEADDLAAYLTSPDGSKRKLGDVTMKNTLYLTENAAWRVKEFLKDCGFDPEDDGMTMREMVEQTTGKQVGVVIVHEASQDGQSVYSKIGKTVAVE